MVELREGEGEDRGVEGVEGVETFDECYRKVGGLGRPSVGRD